MLTLDAFEQCLKDCFPQGLNGKKTAVALSGGLDSVVLLHLLVRAGKRAGFVPEALHIHHGLSPRADDWADFCQNYCDMLGVGLETVKVCVEKNGLGIEAAARQKRYAAFAEKGFDILALAHHRDDQIETFMLAVARGGGLRALAAMPAVRPFGEKGIIWRPLLPFSRQDIWDYAQKHGLPNIEDESNTDTAYLRNRFRHRILPELSAQIPHFGRHVLNNVRALQEDLALLDEVVVQDCRWVCGAGYFDTARWLTFSPRRKTHILRHFLKENGIPVPNQNALADIARVLTEAKTGRWNLQGFELHHYAGRLFVFRQEKTDKLRFLKDRQISGNLREILTGQGFVLKRHPFGLPEHLLEQDGILRTVAVSDTLAVGGIHKDVKKILQGKRVLSVLRPIWPLVADSGNRPLALANCCADFQYSVSDGILPVHPDFPILF
ncbi:TPA: tRNA lysidine(34) synthetase TilS [Neisseria meningitidis]|uniref:tRNA lysidine(34) synthetase TilS n=1 Tax=Neisseria meningitidis TaxID=487 RepID=UPI001964AC8D|nr:tRNA lysidine(34) synthetase TilS [Neisseria meningitidis]